MSVFITYMDLFFIKIVFIFIIQKKMYILKIAKKAAGRAKDQADLENL
jgi:hypothetical protein